MEINEIKKAHTIIDELFYDTKDITQWQHRLLEDVINVAQAKIENPKTPNSVVTCIKTIRENFEMWRKGEIKDGALSFHIHNNLLRIEKQINQPHQ